MQLIGPIAIALWLGVVILIAVLIGMPPGLPKGSKGAKLTQVFATDPRINWLSAARLFLFGARDIWFVVGIPIYFYAVLSDGTEAGNRATFFTIGTFMAVWIILYGFVQGLAPKILKAAERSTPQIVNSAIFWVGLLALVPAALAAAVYAQIPFLTPIVVAGLLPVLLLSRAISTSRDA